MMGLGVGIGVGVSLSMTMDLGLVAVLAVVTLASSLGDHNASFTDRGLACVALHQMLAVLVTLFTDRATTVLFPATIANNSRTETAGFLLAHGVSTTSAVLLGDISSGSGLFTHGGEQVLEGLM
ncbi:hypothetical protein EDD21DRAFT_388611 [Dissophora ornata]|nr:hypothetical protein EDD21DRAFT_388611 [Dissophora ornata]